MTFNEIVLLNQFIMEHKAEKMPVKTAYKLTKLHDLITSDYNFFSEQCREIVQKYSNQDENGQTIIPPDNVADYNKEINDLLSTEVIIPDITFSLNDFDGMDFTVEQLAPFMPLIIE